MRSSRPTHVKRLRSTAATSAHCLSPCPLRPLPLPLPENSRRPRGCSRSTPDHAWVLPEFLQESNESRIPLPSPPPHCRSNRIRKRPFWGPLPLGGHLTTSFGAGCLSLGARCVRPPLFRYYSLEGQGSSLPHPQLGVQVFVPCCKELKAAVQSSSSAATGWTVGTKRQT